MSIPLAQTIAASVWIAHANATLDRLSASREQLSSQGSYVDYNANTGTHTVKTSDGKTFTGAVLTNAGLATGDRMAVNLGDRTNFFKAQPR